MWDSQQNSARDALGAYVKLVSPTIANGKVYVSTASQLVVYGLLNPPAPTFSWTGASGTDTNWSTALNWTNVISGSNAPPGFQNNVIFGITAAVSLPNIINNVVDTSQTVGSLQYANNATSPNYHVTLIAAGKTLVVTNLIVGTATDSGANNLVNAVVTGSNGTLTLNNNVLAVSQGSGTDGPHQAVLDLSGLDTLNVTNTARIAIAVSGVPPQSGNGGQRCSGVLYLAKTNFIAVTSTGVTNGILVGWNDSQGNGAANPGSALYLGQTNAIFTDAIYVGTDKTLGCLLAFNPIGLNNPSAYFRGRSGAASRISLWGIGDTSMKGNSNQSASGTNDFSGGSVDALVGNLNIGVTTTGAGAGPSTGNGTGMLTFNAGTIDVNNVTNGWSTGTSTAAGSDVGTGTINVNSAATLKVNNVLALAQNTSTGSGIPSGTLNVNGGTVRAASIVAGSGISTITLAGGTLVLTNTAGTPASPLSALSLASSSLHLGLNGASILTNVVVSSLTASGTNSLVIDSLANVTGVTTFPLISYSALSGSVAANFTLATLPSGYSGALVDNSSQQRIDLNLAPTVLLVPRIASVALTGAGFVVAGTNGPFNKTFYVLASTNVTLPLSSWTPLATNVFDAGGNFQFTNTLDPSVPSLFYRLQVP
jgi:hypothetical protein